MVKENIFCIYANRIIAPKTEKSQNIIKLMKAIKAINNTNVI